MACLLQLFQARFEIGTQFLTQVAFHALSNGTEFVDYAIEFFRHIIGNCPRASHVAGF